MSYYAFFLGFLGSFLGLHFGGILGFVLGVSIAYILILLIQTETKREIVTYKVSYQRMKVLLKDYEEHRKIGHIKRTYIINPDGTSLEVGVNIW